MEYLPVGQASGQWDKRGEGIKWGAAPRQGTGYGKRHDEEPGRGSSALKAYPHVGRGNYLIRASGNPDLHTY